MNLRAFRCGANVIAYIDNNQKYGMTCAWAMMVDYSKINMLIGGQSETGNNLQVGMNVGVSALSCGQQNIARIFGMNHSSKTNKFADIDYTVDGAIILINNAKVQMKCTVEAISDLDGDHLVTLKVNSHTYNDNADYLDGYDPKCYEE